MSEKYLIIIKTNSRNVCPWRVEIFWQALQSPLANLSKSEEKKFRHRPSWSGSLWFYETGNWCLLSSQSEIFSQLFINLREPTHRRYKHNTYRLSAIWRSNANDSLSQHCNYMTRPSLEHRVPCPPPFTVWVALGSGVYGVLEWYWVGWWLFLSTSSITIIFP